MPTETRDTIISINRAAAVSRALRPRAVRYTIVGLGRVAQNAVLPAFTHACRNSRLAAPVSDHPIKLNALAHEIVSCWVTPDGPAFAE